MTLDQIIALIVLVAVVGLMIHGRMRSDVVALSGAAALLLLGVVRPVEVQSAFTSSVVLQNLTPPAPPSSPWPDCSSSPTPSSCRVCWG